MRLPLLLSLLLAASSLLPGDTPVKTHRTLLTPELVEARKNDVNLRNLALNGDSMPFCAAVGNAPAARWVDKPDEWFWHSFPGTRTRRLTALGADDFARPKLGCPVHGQEVFTANAYYPWVVDCEQLPFKLKCPIGGETYPSNDYGAGDLTTGPYADDGSGCVVDGKRYYFIALYNHYAYNTLLQPAIKSFGHAYLATGDPRYAHKAAVCLLKEAFEYPNATNRKDRTYHPGYGDGSGMITDVVWSAGALNASALCYDEIFETIDGDAALLAFARQKIPEITCGADLRLYLEDHLFRPGIQAIMDKRIQPNTGWAQESMASLGLLLADFGARRPNSRDCLDWLYTGAGRLKTMGNQFYKDGSSYESTGYNDARLGFARAGQIIERLRALAPAQVDPQRYPDITANEKLRNMAAVYKPAISALGGQYVVAIGDCGDYAITKQPLFGKRERASEFLDGYGLGLLRSGTGAAQRDAVLFYGGVRGHAHYDPLTVLLYGHGRDLLPNIGYPQSWSMASAWEWSLLTHNTVAVDRNEKPCSTVIGSLTLWAPAAGASGGEGRVQVMEAAKRPYRKDQPRGENGPDVTDYRRLHALVDVGPDQWYVVDLFRVTGGSDHVQSWHGAYTPRTATVTGAQLVRQERGTLAGEDVVYGQKYQGPDGQERCDPYCHLKDVARGPMGDLTSMDFDYDTPDQLHLRLNFVPVGQTELITARGGAPITPDKDVLQWAFPHRAGSAGLQSQFVTLIESYTGTEPVLSALRRLPAQAVGAAPAYEPIVLEVTVPGGRDIILLNGAETDRMTCGAFALTGKFGLIRERGGRVISLHLAGGSKLTAGKLQLTLPPPTGPVTIAAVDRAQRQIILQGPTPPLATLTGRRLMIDNHGERLSSYTIVAAERRERQVVLTLDSSGNIGEGVAAGFEDGIITNGPEVNMPFAGLVKIGDRLDTSDCFYRGGHLETGRPGVDLKVLGVMGYPYQAWGLLHNAGINHVHLAEKLPAARLQELVGAGVEWKIYEYGVGDEVRFDHSASLEVK